MTRRQGEEVKRDDTRAAWSAQVFGRYFLPAGGKGVGMGAWALLFIPATPALISLLLVFSEWAEDRVVSPRALIVRVANGKHLPPERAEAVVVAEIDRLLNRPGLTTISR